MNSTHTQVNQSLSRVAQKAAEQTSPGQLSLLKPAPTLSLPAAAQTSLLSLCWQGFTHLMQWLFAEPAEVLSHRLALHTPSVQPPAVQLPLLRSSAIPRPPLPPTSSLATPPLQINQHGMAIIKHFDGYPADIEPDVREAEQAVRRLVRVPLTENQFSALVSFTFNVGETTFSQSPLLQYLNAGRYRAAARDFDCWVYVGCKRFPQLVARRVAEAALFLKAESA